MATRGWNCAACGKNVQPLQDAAGQQVCPLCAGPVAAVTLAGNETVATLSSAASPPRPSTAARSLRAVTASRPAVQRPASPMPRRPLPTPRPPTPHEALPQSSPWIPDSAYGSSPDAVTHRTKPRRPDSPSDAAAGTIAPQAEPIPEKTTAEPAVARAGGGHLRSPLVWGSAGACVVLLILVAVMLPRGSSAPPADSTPAADGTPTATPVAVTGSPAAVADAVPAPAPDVQRPVVARSDDNRYVPNFVVRAPSDTPAAPATPVIVRASIDPPAAPPASARLVNLLPLIDLKRDVLAGKWLVQANGLAVDNTKLARLRLPYVPPAEYDFRIEFTRTGNEDVVQMFIDNGHPCAWLMGGWTGTIYAFHEVGGKIGKDNPTAVKNLKFPNNVRHTSVVRVRKDQIAAFIDGNLVSQYVTEGKDLNLKEWSVGPNVLGIGTYQSPAVFHAVEVIELSGSGHIDLPKSPASPPAK